MVGTHVRSLFGSSVWGSARTDFLEPFIDQAHAVGVTGSVARTQQTSFQFPILRNIDAPSVQSRHAKKPRRKDTPKKRQFLLPSSSFFLSYMYMMNACI